MRLGFYARALTFFQKFRSFTNICIYMPTEHSVRWACYIVGPYIYTQDPRINGRSTFCSRLPARV